MSDPQQWHGTTILSLRKGNRVVIAGDGQVSIGPGSYLRFRSP